MSQTIARSTVFLDEMGLGVQWKLRNPAVGEETVVEDDVAGEPVAVAAEAPPAPVPAAIPAPVPAPVAVASPAPAPVAAPGPVP